MNQLQRWSIRVFGAVLAGLLILACIVQFEYKHFPIDDPDRIAATGPQRHLHCRDIRKTQTYVYSMPEDKRASLIKKLNKVQIGDAKTEVVAALGAADFEENLKQKGDRFLFSIGSVRIGRFPSSWKYGSQLVFFFDKSSLGGFDCRDDRYVSLKFNNNDRLVIIDSNVPDVPERPRAPTNEIN